MVASTRGRLRRVWFYVHMWIGVALAAALIPLSVSGSYLVWRDEIEQAVHPERFAVGLGGAVLSPSAYTDAAQAAFGDKALGLPGVTVWAGWQPRKLAIRNRLSQDEGEPVAAAARS